MPRTLPWLKQTSTSTANTAASTSIPVLQKRRRLETEGDALSAARERRLKRMDTFAPPSVEYMVHSDDHYIMVEDELHDIAHQFTRSLHRAEYQRLQVLAASKNANSISEIQRPTDGSGAISKEHLTKLKRIARVKEEENLLKNVPRVKDDELNSDEEEKERMSQWEGTNLGALMLSPGQRKRDLSTKWKMKATTRAAAGFHRGKSELVSQRQTAQCVKGCSDIDEGNVSRRLFGGGMTRESLAALVAPGHAKPEQSLYKWKEGKMKHRADKGKEVEVEHNGTGYEDDDLDAPIIELVSKASAPRHTHHYPAAGLKWKKEDAAPFTLQPKSHRSPIIAPLAKSPLSSAHAPSATLDLSIFDDFLPLPAPKSGILGSVRYKGKAMAALSKKRDMEKMK
ncbi:hypothetical protein EV426DRAFT_222972 [Tirmania nivea]|nr:hypothetical protein EV426DRAFT_222972 [Tirmania nivea]